MAELKRTQLKAATLLEVIVAMVIIMVVFVIATAIYTNVIRSSPTMKQQRARALATALIRKSLEDGNWEDETELTDSIALQKTVSEYPGHPDLRVITVRAAERGRAIGMVRQIVKKEKQND